MLYSVGLLQWHMASISTVRQTKERFDGTQRGNEVKTGKKNMSSDRIIVLEARKSKQQMFELKHNRLETQVNVLFAPASKQR